MVQVINDLFINCMIIISTVTFANMLLRERHFRTSSMKNLVYGFGTGILGCILMLYSVHITPEIILDFRFIPIVMMGLYLSFTSSIEAAILIALFRILYFGVNRVSIISAIVTVLIGVGCGLIGKVRIPIRFQWLLSLTLVCTGSSIGLSFVIQDGSLLAQVLLTYLLCMAGAFILMYFFIEYIAESNRRFVKIAEESTKDCLTNLQNRRCFDQALSINIERAKREQISISLLYIDIDHFKLINDRYGHTNGDALLKEVGSLILRTARSLDLVSRYGGEEFTILLVGCPLCQAMNAGERIRRAIESNEFRLPDGETVKITASIGIASFPDAASDHVTLFRKADASTVPGKEFG